MSRIKEWNLSDSGGGIAQTCSEGGLHRLAPLVSPVGSDADDVSLPRLQAGYSKTSLASIKLHFNRLDKKQQ